MSLKMSMFVFRLLQNEYSASITAQNSDLISGYNLCRREAQEKPTADVFYLLARGLSVQPLISSYLRLLLQRVNTQGHFSCILSAIWFGIFHSVSLVSLLPIFTFF